MKRRLKSRYPKKELIVEVRSFKEWEQARQVLPTVVMFDNWDPKDLAKALRSLKEKKFEVEISGRIDLENIDSYLSLPIDRVSIGCITHSAPIVDFSLEIL
jgi:nicotinate-nucleotide pyrophosphorylase (carboxylating)